MDIISILIGITICTVIVCLIVMYIALQGIATAMREAEEVEKIEEQPELEECEFCGFLTDSPCTEPPAAFCEQAMELIDRNTQRKEF